MFNATYFDGRNAAMQAITLAWHDGMLRLAGAAIERSYRFSELRLGESFLQAPTMLYLPDGAHCEVTEPEAKAALERALAVPPTVVMRWQRNWPAALAALALLLALGFAIWQYGLPAAAEKIADGIPASMDESIGSNALRSLDAHLMQPSRLSPQRIEQLRAVLAEVAPPSPRHRLHLEARDAPLMGPNALALPDGTIVITDQLVHAIYDSPALKPDEQKAALGGVLSHEIGHIEQRHSVRVLARSSLTAAASAAVLGDFSAVAAGLPAVLSNMRFSREMETQADSYAIAVLARKGWSTEPLAKTFEWLEQVHQADPRNAMPAWMKTTISYAASHPGTAERIARLRAVAPPTHPD